MIHLASPAFWQQGPSFYLLLWSRDRIWRSGRASFWPTLLSSYISHGTVEMVLMWWLPQTLRQQNAKQEINVPCLSPLRYQRSVASKNLGGFPILESIIHPCPTHHLTLKARALPFFESRITKCIFPYNIPLELHSTLQHLLWLTLTKSTVCHTLGLQHYMKELLCDK